MNASLSQVFSQRIENASSQLPPDDDASSQLPPDDDATDCATNATSNESTSTPTPADDSQYEGIDWQRLLKFFKPPYEPKRTVQSWVWRYGYRIYHPKQRKQYWLCRHCHTHRAPGGLYTASDATSAIQRHLKEKRMSWLSWS